MRDIILNHLKKAGEPLPACRILLDALQIRCPSNSKANEVLDGILGKDRRFGCSGGLWYANEGAPFSRWEGEAAFISIESADQQRNFRAAVVFSSTVWSIDTRSRTPRENGQSLSKLRVQLNDRPLAGWSEKDLRLFNSLLHEYKINHWFGDFLPLRSVAARIVGRWAGALDLQELASALKVPAPAEYQPEQYASFLSECLPLLLDRVPPEHRFNIDVLRKWIRAGKRNVDFSRFNFGPDFLDEAPSSPGVYIMRDQDGAALYVGKSRNLKRRIRSYFSPKGLESPKTIRIHERLHSLEWHSTPNEVEALLREMRLIRKLRPWINLQTEVHERRKGRREINRMLIVRGDIPGKATIYFVHKGLFTGKRSVLLHCSPSPKLREKIKALYFSGRVPNQSRDLWRVEIASRWIFQNSSRLNWIDVDEAGSYSKVIDRLCDYLCDPEDLRNKVYYR